MFSLTRIASFYVLGPFLFYPFTFCPYGLPYLYCLICPRGCYGGHSRGLAFLVILGLNINKQSFCNKLCPLGTLQVFLYKLKTPKLNLPKLLLNLTYISLGILAILIIATLKPEILTQKIVGISLNKILVIRLKGLLLWIFLLSIILSIFSFRIFCYNICPIRALSKISRRNNLT